MATNSFKPGDIVGIQSPREILKTLDSSGTLDDVPFMPEMTDFLGKKFRVFSHVGKICVDCLADSGIVTDQMKEFIIEDVYILDGLRCNGKDHDECQRGCMIFWKEAWLKKVSSNNNDSINKQDTGLLLKRLNTGKENGRYFCQSTTVHKSTVDISLTKRRIKLIREMFSGEIPLFTGIKSVLEPKWRKSRPSTLIRGMLTKTPTEVLNLQPGELVEIKPFEEILNTLDQSGQNKGLQFVYGMKQYCGKKFVVRSRLDRMIDEYTGKMIKLENTVILENNTCNYSYRLYGCHRERFFYWREIWLKRVS